MPALSVTRVRGEKIISGVGEGDPNQRWVQWKRDRRYLGDRGDSVNSGHGEDSF
jgi:hypothetical protein